VEHSGRPNAELCAAFRFNPVSDGDDHIQVIHAQVPANPARTLLLNHRGFLGSCVFGQFAFLIGIPDMKSDRVRVLLEQFRHLPLTQPDSILIDVRP